MPRDAKLGFVIGLGLVVFIAMVFFKKERATAQHSAETAAPAAVTPPSTSGSPPPATPSSPQLPVTMTPSPQRPALTATPVAAADPVPN
jgi:hypothetical protein